MSKFKIGDKAIMNNRTNDKTLAPEINPQNREFKVGDRVRVKRWKDIISPDF